ncbi:MAG: AAA family ATPase [Gammaproteobacteria bacterium]|nr:AAA family ATPase [Gammaproteobacteria bacterium]
MRLHNHRGAILDWQLHAMHRVIPETIHLDRSLINGLRRPDAFDHSVDDVEIMETHISWLILAGDYVYKIKKPLVLDFLDFGSLEKRRFYCYEELRLNKPAAPELYIDVIPVTVDDHQLQFGGTGEIVEYALRMRRFDQSLRLDNQLELGALTAPDMGELAVNIAKRHAQAARVPELERDRIVSQTKKFIHDNFGPLRGFVPDTDLDELHEWTRKELERIEELLWQRFDQGYFRDCHGDLHLGNLVRLPSGITTFDCIEFNSDLRSIDVICDIAFLVMDLVVRNAPDLAARFLNRYLELSGDYAGVSLLDTYFVYRCLVRAKIASIRSQERDNEEQLREDRLEAERYVELARRQSSKQPPLLIIMTGLSGSGKTHISGELLAALPAIRLRSDIERKRMFDLAETEQSNSDVGAGIYTAQANEKIYSRLAGMAVDILRAGHNVIVDATFLLQQERSQPIRAARACGFAVVLLHVHAPVEILRQRIRQRAADDIDASEANLAVLEYQIGMQDPLTKEECRIACQIENVGDVSIPRIVNHIRASARPG